MGLALGGFAAVPPGSRGQGSAAAAPADSVSKYKFLGKSARDKEDHDGVIHYYTELIKYQPDYRPAYYYLGRAFLAKGQRPEAKAALLTAARLDTTHVNTSLSLYEVYVGEQAPDSAWVFLARLVRDRPDEPKHLEYRRAVADLYRRQGDAARAIEHYAALVESRAVPEATRQELYELLAVLCSDRGDAAGALAWRQRLAATAGGSQAEALAKMVDLQVQTQRYQEARQTLRTLALIDSAGRWAHYHRMAEVGDRASDPGMRLEGLEGMARAQPQDVDAVAQVAQFHLNAGDLAAAAQWIQRGLRSAPAEGQLRVLEGDLLVRQGDGDAAVAAYQLALGDPDWAQVAQQRIWQIRPPETEEEKLKKFFFGSDGDEDGGT